MDGTGRVRYDKNSAVVFAEDPGGRQRSLFLKGIGRESLGRLSFFPHGEELTKHGVARVAFPNPGKESPRQQEGKPFPGLVGVFGQRTRELQLAAQLLRVPNGLCQNGFPVWYPEKIGLRLA
jgi:hypothetical protein